VNLIVLGSGQDGGIPHTGCYCPACNRARRYTRYRRLGPSVALFDSEAGVCHLIDASPDFKAQIDMIHAEIPTVKRAGKIPVSGILLTHAHYGHIAGLLELGKEVLNERGIPVYCTAEIGRFLSVSPPFSHLVRGGNIRIREVCPGAKTALRGFGVTALEVPHRNEIADTVGYIIEARSRLAYIPDADRWTDEMLEEVRRSDVAVLDGTFHSPAELPGYKSVPHPTIQETVELLKGADTEVYFTHINHTNPVNRHSRERKSLERKGFKVAHDGLILTI
jgi:pyrroloquinoline quinone biosynthesis protein B